MHIKEVFLKMKNGKYNKTVKWSFFGLIVLLGISIIGYCFILYGGGLIVDESKLVFPAKTTLVTDEGEVIKEIYEERRVPIDIEELPDHVKYAFIAIEDRRFYDHAGIDSKSISRAVIKDLVSGSKKEGASTITQQVAKNVFLTNEKTWMRKTKETMAAIYLEKHYSKDEILGMYINYIYFGEGAYGIEEAANTYFQKSAKDLNVSEAALLAGIVQRPNYYNPFENQQESKKRRNVVLQAMDSADFLSTDERLKASRTSLDVNKRKAKEEPYLNSYIDLVMKEAKEIHGLSIEELKQGGYHIVINVNKDFQKIAYNHLQESSYYDASNEEVESSFVAVEGQSGKVIVATGGREYQLGQLNRAVVQRQPGSTIKPLLVYGPALMKDEFNPHTLLVDSKETYGDYTPRNYDNQYEGSISLYESLIYSKNASTVWLLNEIGIPHSKTYTDKMNLNIVDDGLAIGLGGLSNGFTPLELANSYRVMLQNGSYSESRSIEKIYNLSGEQVYNAEVSEETEVFTKEVSWQLTEMLQEAVKTGTASPGRYDHELAGKTGTTQHPSVEHAAKDAWFAGYTPSYSFALWMGYDENSSENYLNKGSEQATILAKHILTDIEKMNDTNEEFIRPSGVARVEAPMKMPKITNIEGHYQLGFHLAKGKLRWAVDNQDERITYHIYEETDDIDKKIGEVKGDTEFTVNEVNPFSKKSYYVVPYNYLTKVEGEPSEKVLFEF